MDENTTPRARRYMGRIIRYVEGEFNPNKLQQPPRGNIVPTNQIERAYEQVYLAIMSGEPQKQLKVRDVGTPQQELEIPTIDTLLYIMTTRKIIEPTNMKLKPTFYNAIELLVERGKRNGYPDVSEQRKDEVTKVVIGQRADGYNPTLSEIVNLLY